MTTPGSEWTVPFWSAFRRRAHQLIAWGYQDALPRIEPDGDEEEITGFIVEAIQERLRMNTPRWCSFFSVKDNNPVPGKGRTGKRRKRPDIIVELTRNRRPEYMFEAKRLHHKKRLREQKYIGKEGLQCFTRGDYASRYVEAGMLGYVQTNTIEYWKQKIKTAIDQDAKGMNELGLNPPQTDVICIEELSKEWTSEHIREGINNISVHHILLDCAKGAGTTS